MEERSNAHPRQRPGGSGATTRGEGGYFDELVCETSDFNPFNDRERETLRRRLAVVVPSSASLRVLNVGYGTGSSRTVYARHAQLDAGIDLSLVALRLAQRRGGGTWLQADVCQLPFAAASFDLVAFSSILHHIADRQAVLRQALGVLRLDLRLRSQSTASGNGSLPPS